jgi:hypothetical protein
LKRLSATVSLALTASLALTLGVSAKPAIARTPTSASRIVPAQEGEVFHHKEAGIQFELPRGWKAKPDGETITVSTADEGVQMVFWVPSEETFEEAVKALDKELGKTIKNQKSTGKPTEDTHNGMPHFGKTGSGEVDGTTIAWSVDVLAAKKIVIILTFAAPELFEKHALSLGKFISSIKKIE